ncbi:GGDEF domain-containing protein [Bowmanella dokdonensis]|uniref:diguanylate cyclase n=1 Tax=Bowmanella dokdonensis TaxID=751969 RepID=A0A939DQQ0_9ALTE|nr:GGDEF domain-containing protein [Bowmanella dokdonensis]MBN7827208.1 diguanylate cyclase [Bowmanella dokdonensis]
MFYRLRNDFRLSVISLLSLCAFVGITPFALYRFWQGNMLAALVDSLILFSILSVLTYAWFSGDTKRSGFLMALVVSAGGLTIVNLLGLVGLFWLYPCFITGFFLTSSRMAVLINGITLLALFVLKLDSLSLEHLISFATTALVVSACAYIFALRNESQHRRLAHIATLDPLTGVKNRRAMEEELSRAVANFERHQLSCALVILDLDHFKAINDNHGHGVGDSVLNQCVQILGENIRKSDRLFRFGGEEFVLLLPGVDRQGMHSVVDNLYQVVRSELKCPSGPVTASYGATLLQAGDTADSWMERADTALYQAKQNGRDKVVLS